jgi:hypothetical protein
MMACFYFHLLQVWRSRLLLLWLLFSFFSLYGFAGILQSAKVQYQEVQMILGLREVVVALVVTNFYTGLVLAAVFGIWTVPYLHEESRAQLTFSLPLSKWVFPAVYALGFLSLFLLQVAALLLSLGFQFGFTSWTDAAFPWGSFLAALLLSGLALESVVFFFAVVSLSFGKIGAFLGGAVLGLILQVSGAFFQAGLGKEGAWFKLYSFLPPLGEVVFDIKAAALWQAPTLYHLLSWIVWGGILAGLLRLRLSRA